MKLDIDNYAMVESRKIKQRGPFLNRDITWIGFNRRVMGCALKKSIPMNERLNFLGITESNLDEFIGVRFANAYNNQDDEPYKDLLKEIKKFMSFQNAAFDVIEREIHDKYNI